ncbi:MAG TPA: hypothetical protein VN285_00950 [Candidatus Deferrimicrobium sp.]|nr:hypothetical protein [Candidatus Deferrimicrobium sp.]
MTERPDEKPATTESGSAQESGSVLEWTCHPVRRRPLVSALVTLFLILVVVMVYFSVMSMLLSALAAVVMFASLAKFYFPTTYHLTNERVTVKTMTHTLHKDWSVYRSCYPDKNGILLSPFLAPSRLENFRGLYVMFWNNRDEVIRFVRAHIGGANARNQGVEV